MLQKNQKKKKKTRELVKLKIERMCKRKGFFFKSLSSRYHLILSDDVRSYRVKRKIVFTKTTFPRLEGKMYYYVPCENCI